MRETGGTRFFAPAQSHGKDCQAHRTVRTETKEARERDIQSSPLRAAPGGKGEGFCGELQKHLLCSAPCASKIAVGHARQPDVEERIYLYRSVARGMDGHATSCETPAEAATLFRRINAVVASAVATLAAAAAGALSRDNISSLFLSLLPPPSLSLTFFFDPPFVRITNPFI